MKCVGSIKYVQFISVAMQIENIRENPSHTSEKKVWKTVSLVKLS